MPRIATPAADPLVVRSARVVTPGGIRPAAVVVGNGRITRIAPYGERADVDLGNLALLPGLVSPPQTAFAVLDAASLRRAMAEIAGTGVPLVVYAEDPGELAEPRDSGYAGFLASRPPVAERRAIETVVSAAAATGARAHIAGLSAAECAAIIGAARAAGIGLTAGTCPHYLFFAAEEISGDGAEFRCRPPIRPAANREALWRALAEGSVSGVSGEGGITPPGLALPAVWTAARGRGFTLADVARWMSASPAGIAGLPAKGAIAEGRDADLIAFDPDATFTAGGPRTPYDGRRLAGVVSRVWLRGREMPADNVDVPLHA
jgi:dihydroorotase-like cyclic amidohydrolase